MAIQKIDADSVYKNSVERLANRPTAASRVGQGGMPPEKLKAAYDALAKLAIEKVNEVIEAINADASAESIAGLIMTPIPTGELDGEYKTLYEVLTDLIDGDLAGYLKLNGLWDDDLQGELEAIQSAIGEKTDAANAEGSLYARIAHVAQLIKNNADAVLKIYDHVWSSKNIAEGAITGEKISAGAVSADKLATDSVTADKIAPGAVGSVHIAAGAVNGERLAAGAVSESKLDAEVAARINAAFRDVSYDVKTGVLTFVAAGGDAHTVDLPLELLISDGWYAAPYDEQSTYSPGEYCTSDNMLLKCTQTTWGEFNASAWVVAQEVAESDKEIVLELASGGVIEIPADAIAGDIIADTTLSKAGQAADAAVVGTKFTDVISRLEELEYIPIKITAISNNYGNVEIGSTVSNPVFTWTLNKQPSFQEFRTYNSAGAASDFAVVMPTDLRSYKIEGDISSYLKFELTVKDGKNTVTASSAINFLNGVYYGAAVPAAYDSAFILGLTKKLASSKSGSVNVTAGAGQYIYYCYPARFGTASFVVGGFTGGFELVDTVSFKNASGYTENYYVYKSEQAGLGALKVEVS